MEKGEWPGVSQEGEGERVLREGLSQLVGLAGRGEAQRRARPPGCEMRSGLRLVSAQFHNVQSSTAIKAPGHLQQRVGRQAAGIVISRNSRGNRLKEARRHSAGRSSLVPGRGFEAQASSLTAEH